VSNFLFILYMDEVTIVGPYKDKRMANNIFSRDKLDVCMWFKADLRYVKHCDNFLPANQAEISNLAGE
jgi:hypothetical protein